MMEYGTKIWIASRGSRVQSEPDDFFGALVMNSIRFASAGCNLSHASQLFL